MISTVSPIDSLETMAHDEREIAMMTASTSLSSDERFRLLVDAIEDYAIYMLDPLGHVTTWNTGAERNKGYRSTEIVGKHFRCFFRKAEAEAGQPEESLAEAARSGHYAAEGWRVRKDGTLFWASVVINAIRDETGCLIGFAKVTRDLTERKANEERFRLLVECVEDYAIYMLDPAGRITTWNMGAERNKGYKDHEIIGKHFSCFFVPADAAAGLPAHALACASTDGHYSAEGWRVRKNGTLFWASVVINAMRNDRAELIGFAKVTRDLTERKASEEALYASKHDLEREKHRLQVIIRAIGDGVISTDGEGLITMMNPAAEAIVLRTFAQVAKRPIEEVLRLVDAESGETVENPLRRCLAQNLAVQRHEVAALLLPNGVSGMFRSLPVPSTPTIV